MMLLGFAGLGYLGIAGQERHALAAQPVDRPSFGRPCEKSPKKCERSRRRKFFAIFLLLIDLRPRKQAKTSSV